MSKSGTLLSGLLVVLLLALVYLAYSQLEWQEKTIDLGPQKEARQKPFLAAKQFLARVDRELTVEQGYTRLDAMPDSFPDTNELIIISDGYASLSPLRAEKLLSWVKQGGHLMISASNPFLHNLQQQYDEIFHYFAIELDSPASGIDDEVPALPADQSTKSAEADESAIEETEMLDQPEELISAPATDNETQALPESLSYWDPKAGCADPAGVTELSIYQNEIDPEDRVNIRIHFNSHVALSFSEEKQNELSYWVGNDQRVQFVQHHFGDGLVSFIADTDIWKNSQIGCYDNAYFLQYFANNVARVWLLANQNHPSLISLLWQRAPVFVSVLIFLVALFIWHYGMRFGAIVSERPLDRRKIIEHIDASAVYLWRDKASRYQLVRVVQDNIRQKMQDRGMNAEAFDQQHANWLASKTGLDEPSLRAAMLDRTSKHKPVLSEHELVSLMKTLKEIEDAL